MSLQDQARAILNSIYLQIKDTDDAKQVAILAKEAANLLSFINQSEPINNSAPNFEEDE